VKPFEEIFAEHRAGIGRLACSILHGRGDSDLADDLAAVGMAALWDAWRRFDVGRKAPFWHFASRRIRGAMIDELRRLDHVKRHGRLKIKGGAKLPGCLLYPLPLEDAGDRISGDNPERDFLLAEDGHLLRMAMDRMLEGRQRMVIRMRYFEDASLDEIGRALVVTGSRVSQIEGEALAILRSLPLRG
jgi:RNA polymerase sigma factor FliA